jgi:RNase H-fold protein (predicted Holliday junction resolvase)
MKEQYSVDEILNAIDDLQNLKKEKKIDRIVINKPIQKKKSDIPSNTLRLIEEAEKTIRSKLQLE